MRTAYRRISDSVRNAVDDQARDLCADTEVPDTELHPQLIPLISAAGVSEELTNWWAHTKHGGSSREDREDFASTMFLELANHVDKVDRERIARGSSFCGWLYSWGRAAAPSVAVTAYEGRRIRHRARVVSLESIAASAGVTDLGDLEAVRRQAAPQASSEPDLADPAVVRKALARRRGAGREAVVAQILKDALDLPALIRPDDPVETQQVRQAIVDDPRLGRRSLDAARALIDGEGTAGAAAGAPEAMVAMWDSTTVGERERLSELPDQILALHVADAVRLAPRPAKRVRAAVRRALARAAATASTRLVEDLMEAFWDEATEAVSAHHTGISAAQRSQITEGAARSARRLPALAWRVARTPGCCVGRDAQEVRAFLTQAWAMAEATLMPHPA